MTKNKYPKFFKYTSCNVYRMTHSGVSFGLHISQTKKRFDLHFLNYIFSFGKIPIYEFGKGKFFAVSDSYHETISKRQNILYAEPTNNVIIKERK